MTMIFATPPADCFQRCTQLYLTNREKDFLPFLWNGFLAVCLGRLQWCLPRSGSVSRRACLMQTVKRSRGRHNWRHERTSTRLPKPLSATGKIPSRYIPYKVWGLWIFVVIFVRLTVIVEILCSHQEKGVHNEIHSRELLINN